MSRSPRNRHEMKRMDALLALPLDRFRRELTHVSAHELTALEARLGVQRMKHGLARGEFGIERHRSLQALALLARRETALQTERDNRLAAAPAPIQLVFPEAAVPDATADVSERQAA